MRTLLVALTVALAGGGALADPPVTTPGQAAAAGKAMGAARNPATAANVTTATGTATVPNYNTAAPEQSYFGSGNGNVAGPTAAKLAACAGLSTAECVAVNLMQQKASVANPITINPLDPLVVNARSVTKTPAPTLGVTNGIFVAPPATSTCAPATTTTGGNSSIETCETRNTVGDAQCVKPWNMTIQPWWTYTCEKSNVTVTESTCEKTLNVTVDLIPNCTVGDVIQTTSVPWGYSHRTGADLYIMGGVVRAYCDPAMASEVRLSIGILDVNEHDFGSQADYHPPPDLNLIPTLSVTLPTVVPAVVALGPATQYLTYALPGSGCDAGTGACNYSLFAGPARWTCPASKPLLWSVTECTGGDSGSCNTTVYNQPYYDGDDPAVDSAHCLTYLGPASPSSDIDGNTTYSCAVGTPVGADCYALSTDYAPSGPAGGAKTFSIAFQKPRLIPTITDESTVSTCGGVEGSPTCTMTGSICEDGPSTRIINGLSVTRQCWRTKYDYECTTAGGPNNCAPLTAEPLCAQTSVDTCRNYSVNGTCISFDAGYKCTKDMGPPPSVTLTGHGYSIVQDMLNESACDAYRTNANCVYRGSVCTDSADKTFYGFTFSKPCWSYTDTYTCPGAPTSTCQPLVDRGCTVLPAQTACISNLPSGACDMTQYYYQCGTPATTTTTATTCDNVPYCINGVCYDLSRPSDPDFSGAVAMMEAAREASAYIDPATFEIFKGTYNKCTKRTLVNCCKGNGGGGASTNGYFYTAVDFGRTFAGSNYMYDVLFSGDGQGMISAGLESLGVIDALGANTFSAYGVTIGWGSSGFEIVAFDPYSFVIAIVVYIVVTELMSCEDSDRETAVKKDQGICENMGSWCSSKFLGTCLEKKEGYCCFNSRLAKDISMQGKVQLGISLGSPQSPNCEGLTIDQINSLDFSRIDISDFVQQIAANAVGSTDAINATIARLANPNTPPGPPPLPSGGAGAPTSIPPPPVPPPPAPPEPTIVVSFTPNSVPVGSTFNMVTATTDATSLSYACNGASTAAGPLPVGTNTQVLTALPVNIGQTTCQFTATGPNTTAITEATYSITGVAATVSASFSVPTVNGGDVLSMTTASTGADSLTYSCTGAMTMTGTLPTSSAVTPITSSATNLGTTTCVFTAHSSVGVVNATASFTSVPVTPTVTASYAPSTVRAGLVFALVTNTTGASSLTYVCTGAMAGSGSLPVGSNSSGGTATVANIGLTTCTLTATSPTSNTAQRVVQLTVTP